MSVFHFNWVDFVILAGVLIFFIDGVRTGFAAGILELLGFLISLAAALLFFAKVEIIFTKFLSIPESFTPALGFLTVWLVAETVYYFLARKLFSKIPEFVLHHVANRATGIIPAIVNSLLLAAFLLTLFTALPVPANLKSEIFNSEIGGFLVSKTSQLEKPLQNIFGPAVSEVQKGLTFVTVVPKSRQVVDLGFTQPELKLDAASEQKMIELVNNERVQKGLLQLAFDPALRDVGRAHSRDMFQRGYFSHYSPEGEDVGGRLTNTGVTFFIAGENLAYAPNVLRAHDGLMDSPGHRANILRNEFGKIGIGVIDGGIYGKCFAKCSLIKV